jgi:hypothetical protein
MEPGHRHRSQHWHDAAERTEPILCEDSKSAQRRQSWGGVAPELQGCTFSQLLAFNTVRRAMKVQREVEMNSMYPDYHSALTV